MRFERFDSDTWKEFQRKIEEEKWSGLPIIKASRKDDGKITVDVLLIVPIEVIK